MVHASYIRQWCSMLCNAMQCKIDNSTGERKQNWRVKLHSEGKNKAVYEKCEEMMKRVANCNEKTMEKKKYRKISYFWNRDNESNDSVEQLLCLYTACNLRQKNKRNRFSVDWFKSNHVRCNVLNSSSKPEDHKNKCLNISINLEFLPNKWRFFDPVWFVSISNCIKLGNISILKWKIHSIFEPLLKVFFFHTVKFKI